MCHGRFLISGVRLIVRVSWLTVFGKGRSTSNGEAAAREREQALGPLVRGFRAERPAIRTVYAMMMPDHVLQIEGVDSEQGFAFAFGYIKALIAAVSPED